MTVTNEMVLGFMLLGNNKVVLIAKSQAGPQYGAVNGIGGKVDPAKDDSAIDAMVREFAEETGIQTTTSQWEGFGYTSIVEDDNSTSNIRLYVCRMPEDFLPNNWMCMCDEGIASIHRVRSLPVSTWPMAKWLLLCLVDPYPCRSRNVHLGFVMR